MILEKLNFFLEKKANIHIKKIDRRFLNGVLIEKESDNVFILKERKLGLIHLFASEVFEVSEFMEGGL